MTEAAQKRGENSQASREAGLVGRNLHCEKVGGDLAPDLR